MTEKRLQQIRALVEKLNDLSENQHVVLEILSYGADAIGPLTEFLLSGPQLHPEPRCLAAEALESVNRRVTAIRLLADLEGRSISGKLCALLSDEAPKVRRQAALALAKLGGKEEQSAAAKVIAAFLSDPDWMVHEECREALSLGELGHSRS